MTTTTTALPDTASAVLAQARQQRAVADRAEARQLQLAVHWAVLHPAESLAAAETHRGAVLGERGVPIAGPGAPLVAEFAVAEFAAALGVGTETGKYYLGQAVELRYRLPRTWDAVIAGGLPAWRARRVAAATISAALSAEAAAFVDRHVAPCAHRIRPAQLDRLVDEAVARFMPEKAEGPPPGCRWSPLHDRPRPGLVRRDQPVLG
ncbi:MAG TPA: DUF222 domain-containing protein [Nocardioides sp.]|nr:DUF222 domain-containing protein [Nocardioides sp.]